MYFTFFWQSNTNATKYLKMYVTCVERCGTYVLFYERANCFATDYYSYFSFQIKQKAKLTTTTMLCQHEQPKRNKLYNTTRHHRPIYNLFISTIIIIYLIICIICTSLLWPFFWPILPGVNDGGAIVSRRWRWRCQWRWHGNRGAN